MLYMTFSPSISLDNHVQPNKKHLLAFQAALKVWYTKHCLSWNQNTAIYAFLLLSVVQLVFILSSCVQQSFISVLSRRKIEMKMLSKNIR